MNDPAGHDDKNDSPPAPAPVNALLPTDQGPDVHPVEVRCPYCQANLSRASLGRYAVTPIGKTVEIWHPIVCLECNHPLLFLKEPSKVVRIDGHAIKG